MPTQNQSDLYCIMHIDEGGHALHDLIKEGNDHQRMKQLMKIVKPDISYSGCNAHWFNLLSKDLTPPCYCEVIISPFFLFCLVYAFD